jgi:hypothetical protein
MTEQGFLTGTDPLPLLEYLQPAATERKLRLFACACCRLAWPRMQDERCRQAVETAERYADGLAGPRQLAAVRLSAVRVAREQGEESWAAYWAANNRIEGTIENVLLVLSEGTERAAAQAAQEAGTDQMTAWNNAGADGAYRQTRLLRDLFGNPFRPVAVDPSWLRWQGGLLPVMAQAIYDERRFDDLPILADALEEAGCGERALLAHCREGGEHARGCWVVDALLGMS